MEILCLGNIERGEFQLLWEKLPPESRFHGELGAQNVLTEAGEVENPLWILLLREAPGAFSQAVVDRWKRRYPVSPILTIQGSWCEGESGAEKPLGTHLVYWYDFLAMFPREWCACQQGFASVWTLPELCDVDTWALADLRRDETMKKTVESRPKRIAILSDDWDYFALLRDFFVRDGHTVFPAKNLDAECSNAKSLNTKSLDADAIDVLVYDMPDFREASKARFLQWCEQFSGARRIVTLEFPRWTEWRWLEEQGVVVFPKPFRWTDLRDRVSQWT